MSDRQKKLDAFGEVLGDELRALLPMDKYAIRVYVIDRSTVGRIDDFMVQVLVRGENDNVTAAYWVDPLEVYAARNVTTLAQAKAREFAPATGGYVPNNGTWRIWK